MPKMEFPKFDRTGARLWLGTCGTYFEMYQTMEGYRVAAATLYMVDNASYRINRTSKLLVA